MSGETSDPPSDDDFDTGAFEDHFRELIELEKEQEST